MIKIYFDDIIPEYISFLLEDYEFEMTTFEKCDFVISCKFKNDNLLKPKKIQDLLNNYSQIYKKVIIFLLSDINDLFNVPLNIIFFRTTLYKSKIKSNEYILPYIWNCFICNLYKEIKITNYPIIGFYGKIDKDNELLINMFKTTENTITNIKLCDDYHTFNLIKDDIDNNNLLKDYIKCIQDSHFFICSKNNGNFYYNLYQILSFGRIPIIKDNDMILPFNKIINWNNIAIIDSTEINIIKKIKIWWVDKDIKLVHQECAKIFDEFFKKNKFIDKLFNGLIESYNSYYTHLYPTDFNFNIYNKYNDLSKLNTNDLIKHYIDNGKKEDRIYKLPHNFNVNSYRIKNQDLINLNYDKLINHYINFGYKENRPY
jgi:hypothetical protein